MKLIPYSTQGLDESDIQAVVDVLRSDFITQGPMVERFEASLAAYCGARYAVALSSGTAALHLAALAAGVGSGDQVITSPVTFVATANSALYCGGTPVFVDVEPQTINLDSVKVESYLKNRERGTGAKPKAIIPVHFAGLPCDMEDIHRIAGEHGLIVIEDACHALGAQYEVKGDGWAKVGSCRHSDMTVFSFHPVKHITTGEGGAVTTNSEELYEKLKLLRSHGITKDFDKFINKESALSHRPEPPVSSPNKWYYEMQLLGFNYRITDIQCALGLSQLKKLDKWVEIRRQIAAKYTDAFGDADHIKMIIEPGGRRSSYHLFVVQVRGRDQLFSQLQSNGIGAQVHYIPVHLQPYYKKLGYGRGDFPVAEKYFDGALSIPVFPKLDTVQQDYVIETIKRLAKTPVEGRGIGH